MTNSKIVTEVTITAKQEDLTIKEKHLVYGDYAISYDNQDLISKVADASAKFDTGFCRDLPDVVVKTRTTWRF